jgi:hypothetical protein
MRMKFPQKITNRIPYGLFFDHGLAPVFGVLKRAAELSIRQRADTERQRITTVVM